MSRRNDQIVLGGGLDGQSSSGTISGLALVSYNANGSLDTAFGTGGVVIDQNLSCMEIAIDGSGRIDIASENQVAHYLSQWHPRFDLRHRGIWRPAADQQCVWRRAAVNRPDRGLRKQRIRYNRATTLVRWS